MARKVAFIDRDGTINIDAGYINHPDRFIIYPFALQAMKMLSNGGYDIVIITNQAGLSNGYFTEETMNKIHSKLFLACKESGVEIVGLYYCPHSPSAKVEKYKAECDCRKPKPGLILRAKEELDIDLENSFMIGDKYSDIMAGKNAGCKTILVKTGYGEGELTQNEDKWKEKPDFIAKDLLSAARIILLNLSSTE